MNSFSTKKKLELSEPSLEFHHLAIFCKAASDPLRVEIMRVLSQESFGVQELAKILSVPQPGMSHHLKILSTAGLLVSRRQGNSIFYRRPLLKDNDQLNLLQQRLYATIDEIPLDEKLGKRIAAIYEERSLQSRNYFARNAEKFEENHGLLCELNQYLPNLKELLDLMQLPKNSSVMEVGPGQGRLLEELADRYDYLVALDNSGEMLQLAKGKSTGKTQTTEFINSSLEAYELKNRNPFDAVALNMVMHHMSSPQRALQKLSELVRSGGFLVIADLCTHNQEWTRESCGDIWLGLDPQDLDDWALQAGFQHKQSLYLGLKNGFQIQLKLFLKI